jgi:hypothetical protein
MTMPPFQTYKRNVRLGQGQSLGFKRGRVYYARPAKPSARPTATPYDPLAAWSPQQIEWQVQSDVMPGITSAATALTEALIGRATRSTNEINARSRSIQQSLRPYEASARGVYGDAASRQAQLGSALRSSIAGTGHAIESDLASALAGIQAPGQAVQQIAGGAGQTGEASGQAVGALSSADLERLKGQGGAAATYAGALPRIAQLAGESQRRGVLSEAAANLTDKLGELYAKQPGMLSEANRYYQGLESDKAKQRYEMQQDRAQAARQARQDALALRKQQSLEEYRGANLDLAGGRLDVSSYNARTGRMNAGTSQARLEQDWAKHLDNLGIKDANLKLRTMEYERKLKNPAKKGGFTAKQRANFMAQAEDTAKDDIQGWVDAKTDEVHAPIKPKESLLYMVRHGIPFSIAVRAVAHYFPPAKDWYKPPKAQAAADGGSLDDILYRAGFRGEALRTAKAIAMAESGGRPTAYNPNVNTGDQSYGLFQINMLGSMGPSRRQQYGLRSNEDLYDPLTNARIAYRMSGGGRNWSPWSAYKSGAYRRYL